MRVPGLRSKLTLSYLGIRPKEKADHYRGGEAFTNRVMFIDSSEYAAA